MSKSERDGIIGMLWLASLCFFLLLTVTWAGDEITDLEQENVALQQQVVQQREQVADLRQQNEVLQWEISAAQITEQDRWLDQLLLDKVRRG